MFRVRVIGVGFQGGPSLNTFYFEAPIFDVAHAEVAANRVQALLVASRDVYPAAVSHTVDSEVAVLDSATGEIVDSVNVIQGVPVAGNQAGQASEATATALLLRLNTSAFVDGRRVRGRAFLSPVSAGQTDADGTPSAGIMAAGVAGGNQLLTDLTLGVVPVVWSRPRLLPTPRAGSSATITGVSVPDKFAVLRSRRD